MYYRSKLTIDDMLLPNVLHDDYNTQQNTMIWYDMIGVGGAAAIAHGLSSKRVGRGPAGPACPPSVRASVRYAKKGAKRPPKHLKYHYTLWKTRKAEIPA